MKKYILLITLLCLNVLLINAQGIKDSINPMEVQMPDLDNLFEELNKMEWDMQFDALNSADTEKMLESNNRHIQAMKENLKKTMENIPQLKDLDFGNGMNIHLDNNQSKTPTRTEKKSFANISEVEFFHNYGNIFVQESNSKQIELEIQYFDTGSKQATCTTNVTGKLLSINTNGSRSNNGSSSTINYIIRLPRNMTLDVNLKYGTLRIPKFEGNLSLDMSYGKLQAEDLTRCNLKTSIKYSEIKIENVSDFSISGMYSDFKINNARNLTLKGNYNEYKISEAESVTLTDATYGDFKIGTVKNIDLNIQYIDVVIMNLISTMKVSTSYGDIDIRNVSPQLKSIDFKSNYADLLLSLPTNLTILFDIKANYGDIDISRKYNVKYTESRENKTNIVKKGQIGTGTPSATLTTSANYADIQVR